MTVCQQDCPCVEKVQDSALIPVNVERKVTLVGKHLNVFQVTAAIRLRFNRFRWVEVTVVSFLWSHTQDDTLDYECVLDIEDQSVVVEASVEPDATGSSYLITCEPHQVRKCLWGVWEWGRAPLSVSDGLSIEKRKRTPTFVVSIHGCGRKKMKHSFSSVGVKKT